MPPNTNAQIKALEKAVADLSKKLAALETRTKNNEEKIKSLADSTLDAKGLDKYIDTLEKQIRMDGSKETERQLKRFDEVLRKQSEKQQNEDDAKWRRINEETRKEGERMVREAVRDATEQRLKMLEAKVAALEKKK